MYLPPPSAQEKASFFATSVAKLNLIRADETQNDSKGKEKDVDENVDENVDEKVAVDVDDVTKKDKKKNEKDDTDLGIGGIHPLAIASARLQTNGISELSKAINLANLVQTGEYFAFANVIESSLIQSNNGDISIMNVKPESDATRGAPHATGNKETTSSTITSQTAIQHEQDASTTEANLRAQFILKRKRQQYKSSSFTFKQHHKRLKVVTAAQKVTDRRCLELRKRWRLSAPEHGSVVVAPVRPNETIAIDVDIYNGRSSAGDGSGSGSDPSSGQSSTLGKVARNVPRYATIELSEDFDIRALHDFTRGKDGHGVDHHVDDENTPGSLPPSNANDTSAMEIDDLNGNGNGSANTNADADAIKDKTPTPTPDSSNESKMNTIAQPFAVADPALGSIDLERFDPDNVPMLTLFFQIEKSSTGFVHSVALSASIPANIGSDVEGNGSKKSNSERDHLISTIIQDKVKPKSDERVIQSLQHSLFCANVFDSIWREIVQSTSSSSTPGSGSGSTNGNLKNSNPLHGNTVLQQLQPVWLSSELEDNFLPPPSLMAGDNPSTNPGESHGGYNSSPLSVIHCHEGEVKVQLDSEYALTIKLVDIRNDRTAADEHGLGHDTSNGECNAKNVDSGSETREQIDLLCKLLQLHSQFVFHDHNKRSAEKGTEADDDGVKSKAVDYSMGMFQSGASRNALSKKKVVKESPNILQSCVALGANVLFERKVQNVLKVSPFPLFQRFHSLLVDSHLLTINHCDRICVW